MKAAVILAVLATASCAVLQEASPIKGWKLLGRADADKTVRVALSLKKETADLKRFLDSAASPNSPNFRKWADKATADRLTRTASPDAVVGFLKTHGVAPWVAGDSVVADMTIGQVEAAFGTVVDRYQSETTGEEWHRAGHLHAPSHVKDSVVAVYGLHGLPLPPKEANIHGKNVPEAFVPIGPADLRTAYGVPSSARGSGTMKRQAVAEFQGQYANPSDLKSYFSQYVPYAQPGDDNVYAYKGNRGTGYGVEALLDIEYIMGVAPGVKTEFWGWKNFDFCADLKNWTQTILSDSAPPVVFSVSYGWQGDLKQIGCTDSEVHDVDNDFMKISSRGISIIFASGDSGAQLQGSTLWPSWPASSPYVTAVGATCFTDFSKTEQMASTQFGSGSGFSGMFPIPSFQKSAVDAYISGQGSNLPPSSYWKNYNGMAGRGTADVSALGEGFKTVVNGRTMLIGGTSAATPTFSAIISLLNQKSSSTLGYLNPWIYSTNSSAGWTDITKGSDKISRGGQPFMYGFDCAAGWDPATGLGTPMMNKL